MGDVAELISEHLKALRAQKGTELGLKRPLSRSKLSRMTVREGFEGIAEKTIEAIESAPGRVPEAGIIEELARALGVEPESFYEYPIALARRERATIPASLPEAQGELAQRTRGRRGKADEAS
jgi:transcriptional regulator with XRE-family HTH domain